MANPFDRFDTGPTLKERDITAGIGQSEASTASSVASARTENELRPYKVRQEKAGAEGAEKTAALPTLTPGQQEIDKQFADDYLQWAVRGGRGDFEKSRAQLENAVSALEDQNVTGPVLGMLPDWIKAFVAPEAVDYPEQVQEIAQRNLRLVLGAQFAQKEGEQLIARAFNPRLDEETNRKRVLRLLKAISASAAAKDDASNYFEENGTLVGWKGKLPSQSDFDIDYEQQAEDVPAGAIGDDEDRKDAPPPLSPEGPSYQTATGETKRNFLPDLSGELNAMLRQGATYKELNDYAVNKGASPINRREFNDARQFLRKNPDYEGSLVDAYKYEPLSLYEKAITTVGDNPVGAYTVGAGQFLSGNLMDELAGGDTNTALEILRTKYPTATAVGDVSGGVMGTLGTEALLAKNAARLPAFARSGLGRSLTADTLYGGATGAGGAQGDLSDRVVGGIGGAAAGLTGGAGGYYASRLGQKALSGLVAPITRATGRDPYVASREVATAIKDDDINARDAALKLLEAQRRGSPMAIADLGENTRELLASVGRAKGESRKTATTFVKDRQAQQLDRIGESVRNELGPTANIREMGEQFMEKAKADAGPLYDAAYNAPGFDEVYPKIEHLLKRPSMKRALARAYRIAAEEGRDPHELGLVMDDAGNVTLHGAPTQLQAKAKSAATAFGKTRETGVNAFQESGSRVATAAGKLADAQRNLTLAKASTSRAGGNVYMNARTLPAEREAQSAMVAAERKLAEAQAEHARLTELMRGEAPGEVASAQEALSRADRELAVAPSEGSAVTISLPSWQTLDYVKRGMDDVIEGYRDKTTGRLMLDTEGRAINNTLRTFMKRADKVNPAYEEARQAYAGPAKLKTAMEKGVGVLSRDPDDIVANMRDMSASELEMYRLGARKSIMNLLEGKGDFADKVNALIGSPKKRKALSRVFGNEKGYGRLQQILGDEAAMGQTYKSVATGSPTASRLAFDQGAESGALEALKLGMAAKTGGLTALIGTAWRKIMEAGRLGSGKAGDAARAEVAEILTSATPRELTELARYLRKPEAQRRLQLRKARARARGAGQITGGVSVGLVADQTGSGQ